MKLYLVAVGAFLWMHPMFARASASITDTYVAIGYAAYSDAAKEASVLLDVVNGFLKSPDETNLAKARAQWIKAREPYMQTEVFRFGNPEVDDWEGRVNAWPLDEGLIDYTDPNAYGLSSDANPLYAANVIAHDTIKVGTQVIDAKIIDRGLIERLQGALDADTNVAMGYHAVEFLLWGQDLNGTGKGAGMRKASDYLPKGCTNGNCERRRAYLKAVSELLKDDLLAMKQKWEPSRGAIALGLKAKTEAEVLRIMFTGMGSLSYGELAGERMKLGLMLHDPEEEQDCFSDNTVYAHYNSAKGIANVFYGIYESPLGTPVKGASIASLLQDKSKETAELVQGKLKSTQMAFEDLVAYTKKHGLAYDQLLAPGNKEGAAQLTKAIDALVAQTRAFEKAMVVLGVKNASIAGSESLDGGVEQPQNMTK